MDATAKQFRPQVSSGKLYGRTSHLSAILTACGRIASQGPPEMVLLSGYAGTGKSALANKAIETIRANGVHPICGKFDLLQNVDPLSAIIVAFNKYCDDISRGDPSIVEGTRTAILEALGSDCGVLVRVFPSLRQIIGTSIQDPVQAVSLEAQNRFHYIFRVFLKTIATPSCPVMLFLDDLHNADASSLNLIKHVLTDNGIRNFLFVGSYRHNEIHDCHPLVVQLNEIRTKCFKINEIKLDNVSREDVNELVSDAILVSQVAAKPLADVIFRKTNGNMLFVKQFLQSLCDEGLLQYSVQSGTWEWDISLIEAKKIPRDVVVLLTAKILQLPSEAQNALKLLSCLGSNCYEYTLRLVTGHKLDHQPDQVRQNESKESFGVRDVFSMLTLCVDECLLDKDGANYKFVHDQVQFAAYSLMSSSEKCRMHLQIGRQILDNVPRSEEDDVLFTSVDQLNRGRSLIEDEEERIQLSRLNLTAGQKAMSLATFLSSASYLATGISLLGEDHWTKHYDLSLDLYSSYAEAEYCNGSFHEVGKVTEIILRNALFQDRLHAYVTLVRALGAQNKINEALEIGSSVLTKLGIQCPSASTDEHADMETLMKTKKIYEEMTIVEFLSIREMDDSNNLVIMRFLERLLLFSQISGQGYAPFIVSQMMQFSLRNGICKETATALGFCSYALCGSMKDHVGSQQLAHLALLLLEKMQAQEYLPRVHFAVYGGIFARVKHMKLSLEPLLEGYKVGMRTGDNEYAFIDANFYCCMSFACGKELTILENDTRTFIKQMLEYKQETLYHFCAPLWQFQLNLIGRSENPTQLSGEAMNLERSVADCLGKKKYILLNLIYSYCSMTAYIFSEYDLAGDMIEMRIEKENQVLRKAELWGMNLFYHGLISFALARKTKLEKWAIRAFETLSEMRKYAEIGPCNFHHKLLLLEAENAFLLGSTDAAMVKYDQAIATAGEYEFVNEQAIACERAGDFLLDQKSDRALYYYERAHTLYINWGAKGKADHLFESIDRLGLTSK